MTDPIDAAKNAPMIRSTERITAVPKTPVIHKKSEEDNDELFRDKLDVSPEAHLQNAPDQIDLSLEMIRALIAGELPDEAVTALESFAPIGDLNNAMPLCDRVQSKGMDFITWEKSKTLTQALAIAAA